MQHKSSRVILINSLSIKMKRTFTSRDVAPNFEPRSESPPPEQHSPAHILNALNDDCIQAILRKLTNVEDFLSAAKTCTRFQENAKQGYPPHFKAIDIGTDTYKWRKRFLLQLKHASSFINIFGHLVRSLTFLVDRHNEYAEWDDAFKMIANCCGESLSELFIDCCDFFDNLGTLAQLNALEKLSIINVSVNNFRLPANLKALTLWHVECTEDFKWHTQDCPKLEKVEFLRTNLRDDTLIQFQTLNPQLQRMSVQYCSNVTLSVLFNIGNRTPNLASLEVTMEPNNIQEYKESVVHLSKLKNLKCLTVNCSDFPATILIDSLAENVVAIEELRISGNPSELEGCVTGLVKLKQLKKLIFYELVYMSAKMLIKIAKELPALEEMSVNCIDIGADGIKTVLEHGKHLTMLSVRLINMNIDSHIYRSILALIEGRVKLHLFAENGYIDVDENILKKNKKWLFMSIYGIVQ